MKLTKKLRILIIAFGLAFGVMLSTNIVAAQTNPGFGGAGNAASGATGSSQVNFTGSIPPAVKSGPTVERLIANVVSILFFVLGAASVIAIIVGGIMFASSAGDPERAKTGRQAVLYAVVGLIISLSAVAITTYVSTNLTK